jgi:hypothetical protein
MQIMEIIRALYPTITSAYLISSSFEQMLSKSSEILCSFFTIDLP